MENYFFIYIVDIESFLVYLLRCLNYLNKDLDSPQIIWTPLFSC